LPAPWDMRPIDVAPDWVCEILSPSNASLDRVRKRRIYAAQAVAWYWIVDPAERTLEALRLSGERWVPTTTAPPRGELDVARLFPPG
jgi:Uma2 family endonuclease